MHLETQNLKLVLSTREEVLASLQQMPPEAKAQISPAWLALVQASGAIDPWIHGFSLVHRAGGEVVGSCGFKGPPGTDGVVEIAYAVEAAHQGKGYATEAATALVDYAFNNEQVRVVRAHTLPQPSASTRVLTKCGFRRIGEVIDPDDGLVWRWEKP
jgi:RimJ/RimL family protein N-acetyltransferase